LPGSTDSSTNRSRLQLVKRVLLPAVILLMGAGILFLVAGNWNAWMSEKSVQKTDDAYVQADLTPLSTKVAGLVARVLVSDYQPVKVGDLLVQLRDDDFRAHVAEAAAAVASGENALSHNQREKELQDARIVKAGDAIRAAEADILAAQAGVEAAKSAIATAQAGIDAAKAELWRTTLERRRQEALIASESATRQKVEQAVAEEERVQAQVAGHEAELSAEKAQLSSRQADLSRARAHLASARSELEVQKRQRAVLDSQELLLRSDLDSKRAALTLARIDLGYTRITAPESGIVGERDVRAGQLVSPGTQVISLVQSDFWVQANYLETQLRHMHSGDPAEIRVDAFPGVILKGKVERVAPASGSQFALLPPDNATGNFTKIVQRVPVKIVLDPDQETAVRLRPGLSVIATVRTKWQGPVTEAER
jgi:membrane fusion protein, multidrug efflux system